MHLLVIEQQPLAVLHDVRDVVACDTSAMGNEGCRGEEGEEAPLVVFLPK